MTFLTVFQHQHLFLRKNVFGFLDTFIHFKSKSYEYANIFHNKWFIFISHFSSPDEHSNNLQYSLCHSHTHIHTVHLSATLFLCGTIRGFSILPKDTSACRWGRLGSNNQPSGKTTTALPPQPQFNSWHHFSETSVLSRQTGSFKFPHHDFINFILGHESFQTSYDDLWTNTVPRRYHN